MKLIFATTNRGKIFEIQEILELKNYQNVEIEGISKEVPEPEENGETYKENAQTKFLHYEKYVANDGKILFSEDSGIEIPLLEGEFFGVHCAPFMRQFKTQKECFLKIQNMLEKKCGNAENVPAYFICNICTKHEGKILHFEGKVDGFLTFENVEDEGFGYDPIFIPKNLKKTFAKMKSANKHIISHRAIAFDKFMKYMQNV